MGRGRRAADPDLEVRVADAAAVPALADGVAARPEVERWRRRPAFLHVRAVLA